jgi:hypothetical protein
MDRMVSDGRSAAHAVSKCNGGATGEAARDFPVRILQPSGEVVEVNCGRTDDGA